MTSTREQIQEAVKSVSQEAQQVVAEVLRLESDKLHLRKPRGIVEDITDVVKRIVK